MGLNNLNFERPVNIIKAFLLLPHLIVPETSRHANEI